MLSQLYNSMHGLTTSLHPPGIDDVAFAVCSVMLIHETNGKIRNSCSLALKITPSDVDSRFKRFWTVY